MLVEQYYAILRNAGYSIVKTIPGNPGSLLMRGREGDLINVAAPEGLSYEDRLQAIRAVQMEP